jgi:hypothetical protein
MAAESGVSRLTEFTKQSTNISNLFGNKGRTAMFIKDMLKEELANSRRIKAEVEAALHTLPPGALVRKLVGGRIYCYLAERKAGKVSFAYLGKLGADEIHRYEEAKKQRANYRKQIRELNRQIRYLEKATRGK